MEKPSDYKILKFTKARQMIADAVEQSERYNHIIGIIECDVTMALKIFENHHEKTGERLSFTSWVMKCLAQTTAENRVVQTFRKGRNKMIEFQDVDVKCLVEKLIKGRYIPISYIIRKANEKTFRELNEEIRAAQNSDADKRKDEQKQKNRQKLLMKFPKFIRDVFWHMIMSDPHKIRKNLGTIGLTAMGMFGKGIVGWAIPKTFHATTCAVGAIVKKPRYIDDKLEPRDILHVTLEFDHDVVDGAPAVRFVSRLTELLDNAYGLEDFI